MQIIPSVYPLLRPELRATVAQGDAALSAAMSQETYLFRAGSEIMSENQVTCPRSSYHLEC
jgi:hypothetical protein